MELSQVKANIARNVRELSVVPKMGFQTLHSSRYRHDRGPVPPTETDYKHRLPSRL